MDLFETIIVCRRLDCVNIQNANCTRGRCGLTEIDITALGCADFKVRQR